MTLSVVSSASSDHVQSVGCDVFDQLWQRREGLGAYPSVIGEGPGGVALGVASLQMIVVAADGDELDVEARALCPGS